MGDFMKQLTIFHFCDFMEDEVYIQLQKLKANESQFWSFGEVLRNERGLFEFKNKDEEVVFSKLLDCYFFILERKDLNGVY